MLGERVVTYRVSELWFRASGLQIQERFLGFVGLRGFELEGFSEGSGIWSGCCHENGILKGTRLSGFRAQGLGFRV